jgi:hypothetical protein
MGPSATLKTAGLRTRSKSLGSELFISFTNTFNCQGKNMPEMTIQQFAQAKGVSRQAVFDALKRGRIQRLSNGKLDYEACLNDWTQNTHPGKGGVHQRQREEASKSTKLGKDHVLEILADCFWEFQRRMLPHTSRLLLEAGLGPQQAAHLLKEKTVFDAYIMGEILGLQDEPWIDRNCDAVRLTGNQEALAKQIERWWKESPLP